MFLFTVATSLVSAQNLWNSDPGLTTCIIDRIIQHNAFQMNAPICSILPPTGTVQCADFLSGDDLSHTVQDWYDAFNEDEMEFCASEEVQNFVSNMNQEDVELAIADTVFVMHGISRRRLEMPGQKSPFDGNMWKYALGIAALGLVVGIGGAVIVVGGVRYFVRGPVEDIPDMPEAEVDIVNEEAEGINNLNNQDINWALEDQIVVQPNRGRLLRQLNENDSGLFHFDMTHVMQACFHGDFSAICHGDFIQTIISTGAIICTMEAINSINAVACDVDSVDFLRRAIEH